jgi:uncharacterized membrane protein YqjE
MSGFQIVLVVTLVLAGIALLVLPVHIAERRGHKHKLAIFVCTVVGLFTGVFWLIALIWACTGHSRSELDDELEYKRKQAELKRLDKELLD